jgi:putative ABC transport system permease protein
VNLGEAARAAAREIRVHKIRSLLSFSAISVGTASLLYTLAQTRGMQKKIASNLELMGPGPITVSESRNYVKKGLSKGLTSGDADAIRRELPELYMVSPTAESWNARPTFEGKHYEASVTGVTREWRKRNWVYSLRGRFFDAEDEKERARVALVVEPGGWIKKPFWANFWDLFNGGFERLVTHRDLLGRRLVLNGHDFLVVGALRLPAHDKDPRWDAWNDPAIVVPLTTYQTCLGSGERNPERVASITIDTGDAATLGPDRRRIEALLKVRHRGEADFEVKNARDDLEDHIREQGKYVAVAIALGVVALLSGGIGILNVTLAAVYSRVREIGIRRALGAERADVMALFVAEAALLGLAGGAAGVALGALGIRWLSQSAGERGTVIELTWFHAASMIVLASAVAAAFSAYPAWLASRLDPIEALREEP